MSNDQFNEFIKAVKSNDLKTVENKFQAEFLNKTDSEGYYPIHLVCLNNCVDIFKFFLKHNCDIELLDSHRGRPIHHAIKNGCVEIVKLLLGYRCSIDDGKTLLALAEKISSNQKEIVEVLEKANENRKIGIEMDLKCSFDCDHKFCLISFMMTDFEKDEVIACGSYGKVYKVVESKGDRVFAVKKVTWNEDEIDDSSDKKDVIKDITKDARICENNINDYKTLLSHQHIIKYFAAIKEDYKMFIFMEYAENGSISDLIVDKYPKGLPYETIIKYSRHNLLALDYLHKQNILHRDIKTENVLLDKDDNCKLTDFGCSRLLESIKSHRTNTKSSKSVNKRGSNNNKKPVRTYCGTSNYMAPEIINGKDYLFPCDLFSLGGLVIEMLTGKPPYYDIPQNEVIWHIGNGEKYNYESLKPTTEQLRKFIDQLVSIEPEDRKTAAELLQSDMFLTVK